MQERRFLLRKLNKSETEISGQHYAYQLSPFDADLANVSTYLSQAILLEVAAYPKPGLVTRLDNGSHTDMSLMTFMMSSAVLGKAFHCLQQMGMEHQGDLKELFEKIRAYGILAERELLSVTKGVNTQRGILFAGGVICAAAGFALRSGMGKESLIPVIKKMTSGLVENELLHSRRDSVTAGEKLFSRYGIKGIRGEVEKGFPSVLEQGLPALQEAFKRGAPLNDALVHGLLSLMTVVEDSNVVWRCGISALTEVRQTASDIIKKGSVFTAEGRAAVGLAADSFKKQRVSPGGSADLLSVAIGFYLLDKKEFPTDIF